MISRPLLPRAAFLRGGRQPLAVPAGGPLCSHRPKEGCHRFCCCPVGSTAARSSSTRSPEAATWVPPPPPPRGFPTGPPPQPEPPQRAASQAPAPALACSGPSQRSGAPPGALGESLRRRRPDRGVFPGPGGSTLDLPGGLRLSSVRDLLARNGFEAVEVSERPLYLSEGVVAKADRAASSSPWRGVAAFRPERHASGSREHLFARPAKHLRKQRPHPETPPLPAFVGEDMALYRFAETHAAAFLDRRRAAWTRWVRARVLPPLKNLREKASSARVSATRVRDTFGDALERSLLERFLEAVLGDRCEKRGGGDTKGKAGSSRTSKDAIIKDAGHVDGLDRSSSVDSQKDSPHATEKPIDETTERILGGKPKEVSADDEDEEDGDEDDALEDLVVIVSVPHGKTKQTGAFSAVSRSGPGSSSSSNHHHNNSHHQTNNDDPGDELLVSVTLYGAMTPSTRVLATRGFSLGHSAASTLVSVSLVVSGALPMAHRSYAFCSEYPWLVDPSLVSAALVATVGYTLWAARWRARTARASSVASALCARVCARERAVLLALEEGAGEAAKTGKDPPTQTSQLAS